MQVAGIDPGKKGAILVVSTVSEKAYGYKLRYDKAGHLDTASLRTFLKGTSPSILILEKVQGRGGSGATQTFNFGFACGELNATLRSWQETASMYYVQPQIWQKILHQGVDTKLDAKSRSFVAYRRLFPQGPIAAGPKGGKADDNLIDALLLASYGVLTFARSHLRPWTITMWGD